MSKFLTKRRRRINKWIWFLTKRRRRINKWIWLCVALNFDPYYLWMDDGIQRFKFK